MRIKFIEKWKFKLAGRAVPVIKCEDIDNTGRVNTLHILGKCKDRPNSIVSTWDAKGWEKDKSEYGRPITLIDERGIESLTYVVTEGGMTGPLFTRPSAYPNREDVIGRASCMDDISDAMDLGKSMRNIVIGLIIGIKVSDTSDFGPDFVDIQLHQGTQTLTIVPTTGPGGTVPTTISPWGTPGPGGTMAPGYTNSQAQAMMDFLAANGMSLVELCFLVTVCALLGVKFGK